jgi:hypothetical protein
MIVIELPDKIQKSNKEAKDANVVCENLSGGGKGWAAARAAAEA